MILKTFELSKIKDETIFYLLYGKNDGLKSECIDEIINSNPDIIAIICCGYSEEENKVHLKQVMEDQRINNLPPFKNGKIFAFDSDGLFSRPTLRILEGAKKLRESILKNN